MADSIRRFPAQPGLRPGGATRGGAVPRVADEPVAPGTEPTPSRRLWLLLCLLFVGSSVISLTGLILVIGWIAAL